MAYGLPSIEEMGAYIQSGALARGMDPMEALRVARSEGLQPGTWQSNVVKNGVREPSWGPFQLYTGGGLGSDMLAKTGVDPSKPENWTQGVDFALDSAKSGGWGPWYGAKKQGITGMPTFNNAYATGAPQQPMLLAPSAPPQGGLLDPATGLPPQAGAQPAPAAAPSGMSGLMNFLASPGATGLASGLLMASGPSTTPISLGQAFGSGLQNMSQAQQLATANELKREALTSQALSDQQTRLMNMLTMQGMQDTQAEKAKTARKEEAQLMSSTGAAYNAADGGWNAAKALRELPNGEQLATLDPETIHLVRQGIASAKAAGTDKGTLSKVTTWLTNPALAGIGLDVSTPEALAESDRIITLVETLNKQRANLSSQLQTLASQGNRSAFALQNRLTGQGEGAGLALNEEMFGFARDQILQEAKAYGFELAPGQQEANGTAAPGAAATTPAAAPAGPIAGAIQAGTGAPSGPTTVPPPFATQADALKWLAANPGAKVVIVNGVPHQVGY